MLIWTLSSQTWQSLGKHPQLQRVKPALEKKSQNYPCLIHNSPARSMVVCHLIFSNHYALGFVELQESEFSLCETWIVSTEQRNSTIINLSRGWRNALFIIVFYLHWMEVSWRDPNHKLNVHCFFGLSVCPSSPSSHTVPAESTGEKRNVPAEQPPTFHLHLWKT